MRPLLHFAFKVFRLYGLPSAVCFLLLCLNACTNTDTPLDADTRQRIDSLANAGIRDARHEIDSLCQARETTVLPTLVDSIKKIRLKEIEEQLKTIPK